MVKRLILLCVVLGGCSLYTGDDQHTCPPLTDEGADIPAQGTRDPQTGTCVFESSCSDECPCPGVANDTAGIAAQEGGECNGPCNALDEAACVTTSTCHAAYTVQTSDNEGGAPAQTFWGCWDITPQTPTYGGACANLSAFACAIDPGCGSVYTQDGSGNTEFSACVPTGTTGCDGITCATGSHCEQDCEELPPSDDCNALNCVSCGPTCVPDDPTCDLTCDPGFECAVLCNDGSATNSVPSCSQLCVPTDQDVGSCTGSVTCNMAAPSCPPDTTPGIANGCYTGFCIPTSSCTTGDPGDCYDPVTCNSAPPQCPAGTLPGIIDGCYSGFCIPTSQCELQACETITTEAACTNRSDCAPVYTGSNCTCDANGCTCTTLTFARCESTVMPI